MFLLCLLVIVIIKKKSCFRAAPPVRKQLVLHSKYLEGMPEPALVNEMYEQCFPHSADTTEKNFLTSNSHLWTGMEKAQIGLYKEYIKYKNPGL